MLVFSRKPGQAVIIGQKIEVRVLQVRKGRVKLGFLGPPEVSVHRGEVFCRIANGQGPAKPADTR